MDVEAISKWVGEGIIDAPQLAFLITQESSKNDKSVRVGIEALLPIRTIQPDTFREAINALFTAAGGPSKAPPPTPIPTPSTSSSSSSSTPVPSSSQPNDEIREVCVICVDVSGSMGCPFESERNRLEAVKQMFYGFRDSTTTYEHGDKHRLGLLSYSSSVKVHSQPTSNFDVFEAAIDNMKTGGATAIFDAIVSGCKMLEKYAVSHPDADLRVICLSDGQNNASNSDVWDAVRALYKIEATCDCLIVGDSPDKDLLRLVSAANGESFQILSLAGGYETLESVGIVSMFERREREPKGKYVKKTYDSFRQEAPKELQQGAKIQKERIQKAPVQSLKTALAAPAPSSSNPQAGRVQKRINKELTDFMALNLPYHVFPGGKNGIEFLNILMEGEAGSIYEGGLFELEYKFPSNYPFQAPTVYFVTPIYHYAVSQGGQMCLDILRDNWTPAMKIDDVLKTISKLIHHPEIADPDANLSQRSWLSELLRVNPDDYNTAAREATKKDASQTLEEYKTAHNL